MKKGYLGLLIVGGISSLVLASCALFGGAGVNPASLASPASVQGAVSGAQGLAEKGEQCAAIRSATASPQEAATLGARVDLQLVAMYGPLVGVEKNAPQRTALLHINQVCRSLAPAGQHATEVGILEHGGLNAYSSPSGRVFVGLELAKTFTTDNQIAFVCGHERGHIDGQHAIALYQKVKADTCDAAMGTSVAGAVVGAVGFKAAFNTPAGKLDLTGPQAQALFGKLVEKVVESVATGFYGKDQEFAADHAGIRFVLAAGMQPQAGLKALDALPASSSADHPSVVDRKRAVNAYLQGLQSAGNTFAEFEGPFTGEAWPVKDAATLLAPLKS